MAKAACQCPTMLSAWRYSSPLLETRIDKWDDLRGRRPARGACRQQDLVGSLEFRGGGQPGDAKNRRHGRRYGNLKERQRPHVTQQAAMVGRMVRFLLGRQGERLPQQRQAHQQKNQRGSSYTDAMVARCYALKITRNRVGRTCGSVSARPALRSVYNMVANSECAAWPRTTLGEPWINQRRTFKIAF